LSHIRVHRALHSFEQGEDFAAGGFRCVQITGGFVLGGEFVKL
jgi:hypothetical protein